MMQCTPTRVMPIGLSWVICAFLLFLHSHVFGQVTVQFDYGTGSTYTIVPCPAANENLIRMDVSTNGTVVPQIELLLGTPTTDEGIDPVTYLEFVTGSLDVEQGVGTAPTVTWVDGTPYPRIDLTELSGVAEFTLVFQVRAKATFFWLRPDTDQGDVDNYMIKVRPITGGAPFIGVNSAPFPLEGPQMEIASAQTVDVPSYPEPTTIQRSIVVVSSDDTMEPANGLIILEDVHQFADESVDPIQATRLIYGNVVILRSTNSAVGLDRFVIDRDIPEQLALYSGILSGEPISIIEELNVSGLCDPRIGTQHINSILRLGWYCVEGPLRDRSTKQVTLTRSVVPAGILITQVTDVSSAASDGSVTDQSCYYSPNTNGTITYKIENTSIDAGALSVRSMVFEVGGSTRYGSNYDPGSRIDPDGPFRVSAVFSLIENANWSNPTLSIAQLNNLPAEAYTYAPTPCGTPLDAQALRFVNRRPVDIGDGPLFPDLGPGQFFLIQLPIEFCIPQVSEELGSCPAAARKIIAPLVVSLRFDQACHELTDDEVCECYGLCDADDFEPYGDLLNPADQARCIRSAAEGLTTSAPALVQTNAQYIGRDFNLQGACGFTPDQGWDIRFKWTDDFSLLPRPSGVPPEREKLYVVLELEPYLFLIKEDLEGNDPLTITTPAGTYTTKEEGTEEEFLLRVVDGNSAAEGIQFCRELDCPGPCTYEEESDGSGGQVTTVNYAADGWVSSQRIVLEVVGFRGDDLDWVTPGASGSKTFRWVSKFTNAVVDIPLRMHCPDEAWCEGTSKCPQYLFGCENSISAAVAPDAGPKRLKLSLIHVPDELAMCAGSAPCEGFGIPISCRSQLLNIQCPGCKSVGIHSNAYAINRYTYGRQDADNDGVADNDVDLTYDQVMEAQVAGNPLAGIDTRKAMYGDELLGNLSTSIIVRCGDYHPCFENGEPAVNLRNLYYATKFTPDIATEGSASNCSSWFDVLKLKVIFREPVIIDEEVVFEERMTITIDPHGIDGQDLFAVSNRTIFFDLSPSVLTAAACVEFEGEIGSGSSPFGEDFDFLDLEEWHVDLETTYKVMYNVGLRLVPVEVENNIFFTTRPRALPLESVLSEFDNDPNFSIVDGCGEDPETAPCGNERFFCTKKGGGFTLTGYALDWNIHGSERPADVLPGTCYVGLGAILRFDIENERVTPWNARPPTNAFPYEYRNWMSVTGMRSTFPPNGPGEWTDPSMHLVQYATGLNSNVDTQAEPNHRWPIDLIAGEDFSVISEMGTPLLLGVDAQTLTYTDGTYVPVAGTRDLMLPDDGFSLSMAIGFEANCTTTDGPGTYLRYPHAQNFMIEWGEQGALPSTSCAGCGPLGPVLDPCGTCGELGLCPYSLGSLSSFMTYSRPVLSLSEHGTITEGTCFNDIVVSHGQASTLYGHSSINESSMFVVFDERVIDFSDGLDITTVEYALNAGGYEALTEVDLDGVVQDVTEIISGKAYRFSGDGQVYSGTEVKLRVCANVPCFVRLEDDLNDASDPDIARNKGDAEATMYVGWSCGPVGNNDVLDIADPGVRSALCLEAQTLRYVTDAAEIEIRDIGVTPEDECGRYRVQLEMANSALDGILQNLTVAVNIGNLGQDSDWAVLEGSEAGSYVSDNTNIEVISLPGSPQSSFRWSLANAELAAGESAILEFVLEQDPLNCSALPTTLDFTVTAPGCGVQGESGTGQIFPVDRNIDVLVGLTAAPVEICSEGSMVQVIVVTPEDLTDVTITMTLPAGLTALNPAVGCATNVDPTNGSEVVWIFDVLTNAAPCTLNVQVQPGSCDPASYTISVDAESCCEDLGSGSVTVVVSNTDCLGEVNGTALPGSSCDDDDPYTGNDVYQENCICAGQLIDCTSVPGGPNLPGTSCDDDDASTFNDVYQSDCVCRGTPEVEVDCKGELGGPAVPGTECDDQDPNTFGDLWNEECECKGSPTCSLEIVPYTSPSGCGGPWQGFCGAYPVSDLDQIALNGNRYEFVEGGATMMSYAEGTWALTGEIFDPLNMGSRYWVKLYLDDPIAHDVWVDQYNGSLNGSPAVDEEWLIYSISSDPDLESSLTGMADNLNTIYDLSFEPSFGFQVGVGASEYTASYGAWFQAFGVPRNGGEQLSVRFNSWLNCSLDWLGFTPCNGKIEGTLVGAVANGTYYVTLTGPNYSLTVQTTDGQFYFPDLCNNAGYEDYVISVAGPGGCTRVSDGIVLDNGLDPISAVLDIPSYVCEGDMACVSVTEISGGAAPYTIEWEWAGQAPTTTGQGEELCGVPTDTHGGVLIRDGNGCFITYKIFINKRGSSMILDASGFLQGCSECDGEATVSASGTVGDPEDVAYLWSPGGETTQTIQGLCAGNYTVEVTDGGGCRATTNVVVQQGGSPVLELSGTDPTCFGSMDGTASVTVTGVSGTPVVEWDTSPVQTGNTLTGLGSGIYTATVTTSSGCVLTGQVEVKEPKEMSAKIVYTLPTCSGPCDGTVTAEYVDGQGPVQFLWTNNGVTSVSQTNVCPGPVGLTVTDAAGCSSSVSVTIPEPYCPGPSIMNCSQLIGLDRSTAAINCTAVNASTNYEFSINNGCSYGYVRSTGGANTSLALNFSFYPLSECGSYFVKARAFVAGVWGPWGPECAFTTGGCPNPGPLRLLNAQCGSSATEPLSVFRSAYIMNYAQWNACQYRFKVEGITDPSYNRIQPTLNQGPWTYYPNYRTKLALGTNPVVNCHVYKVRVQAQILGANGVLEWTPYGDPCYIRIIPDGGSCAAMMPLNEEPTAIERAPHSGPQLTVYPNPNDGTVLNVAITGLSAVAQDVQVEVFDVLGRKVISRIMRSEGELLRGQIEPAGKLRAGIYSVQVRIGEVVIERSVAIE